MSTTTSRAAVLLGAGEVEIRTFPTPAIGADDALLRIEAVGVCGSDVGAFRGPVPAAFYELPCVIGHELVGRIEAIGEEAAKRWQVGPGERVVVEEYLPCGTCRSCRAGAYQMCESLPLPRYGGRSIETAPSLWGGFSDYMYVDPRSIVHRVPDGPVPVELLQLYVPISNGLHWVGEIGEASEGDTVVVIGPGPHGLACVVGAREAGAANVVVVGQARDRARLDAALALGADQALAVEDADLEGAVAELTGGTMAGTIVNAADSAKALDLAVALAGDRATIVQVGLAKGSSDGGALAHALVDRLLTLRGVRGRPSRLVGPALELIASERYPLEVLCTGHFEIAETEAAIRAVVEDSTAIRSVVVAETVLQEREERSSD